MLESRSDGYKEDKKTSCMSLALEMVAEGRDEISISIAVVCLISNRSPRTEQYAGIV